MGVYGIASRRKDAEFELLDICRFSTNRFLPRCSTQAAHQALGRKDRLVRCLGVIPWGGALKSLREATALPQQ